MHKNEIYKHMYKNDVLVFIREFYEENGFVPTVREICTGVGIKSTSTAWKYLSMLEDEGKIKRKVKGSTYKLL